MIEFFASPADRGTFVAIDGEGETTLKFQADATQLSKVLPLCAFEKGVLLRVTIQEASQATASCASCGVRPRQADTFTCEECKSVPFADGPEAA